MPREIMSAQDIERNITLPEDRYGFEKIKNLHASLALPSYVHGYSLAIQYMYNWFKAKFPNEFFRGGIYIDGKNVLDDYKRLNDYAMKNIVKGQNPRARIAPVVQYDYDREGLDVYLGSPHVYLRRSKFQDSFFKDPERDLFLGFVPRGLRMDFGFKVRLNSRSEQLDTYNMMELYFRNGSTQSEYISVDFHVPKHIVHHIAEKAGFEIVNDQVVDVIDFINYLNRHSSLPFLFKMRSINQQPEYFIRVNNVYTRIAVRDKLQLDDGERDGKLDFNFHIEMAATLDIPIPHYYAFYSAEEMKSELIVKETTDCVAVYSINIFDIPEEDEHGWQNISETSYQADKGETEIDMSSIFSGDNLLTRAIDHELTNFVSPYKFCNIKIFRQNDVARVVDFDFDWNTKIAKLHVPEDEGVLDLVIYCDMEYVNSLNIELGNYNKTRLSKDNRIDG